MTRFSLVISGYLLLLAFSPAVFAAKTDIVVLQNGDKVTGEVKSLLRGRLELSTDSMGTVHIDWEDIEAVISQTGQSIELANGQRFFGPLRKTENSDMVSIETEQGLVGVGMMDVVGMYPVEAGFWDRLDVKVILGFSWDKGSSVGRYNLALESEYRDPDFITRAGFSSEITTQEAVDDSRRANANLTHNKFRPNKRFISYFGNVESNDQLGIDLRTLVGVGYGWIPIRSNHNWFMVTAGLAANREIPADGDPENNLEAVGRVAYEYFRYSDPERSFRTALTVFPSVTDFGRWRADFSANLDIEFYRDFSWVVSLFANYDSDPISEDADTSKSDYGITSSLAYEW